MLSYGMGQGWPLSCRVCWPSPLLAVLGQSVRALGLVLGMGGNLRPSGLLIGKMHKYSIKKCSIMTKMMGCILYFLRCKYACFGVKKADFLTFWI